MGGRGAHKQTKQTVIMALAMNVTIHPVKRKREDALVSTFESLSEASPSRVYRHGDLVSVGDAIQVGDQGSFLRGHGTRVTEDNAALRATVCGTVERVNRLVTVRPVRQQYQAEVGDVVVGTVCEIGGKRWKVSLKGGRAGQHAGAEGVLHLSAVNLPGNAQRRRTWEDELNMRNVFAEGDAVCCEVQQLHSDGTVALHARSAKYGKLLSGHLVCVPSFLVKRQKQNFLEVEFGESSAVRVVLGYNGLVWVCHPGGLPLQKQGAGDIDSEDDDASEGGEGEDGGHGGGVDSSCLYNLSLVRNVVSALGRLMLPLTQETISQGVGLARELGVEPGAVAHGDFLDRLVEQEAMRRVAVE